VGGVVTTIKAKCRRCYTCIRSCPAKAIRVSNGQAQVIEERCISCGNCYKVCAQQAKEIQSGVDPTYALLNGEQPVIACLAPSFPAAFPSAKPGQVISAVRALGFSEVIEVAFGAQLVAREYARLFKKRQDAPLISTPCPAVTEYVQKYVPALVPHLAPIVSPAVAIGRMIKSTYRPGARTVFFGPCVAKKAEIKDDSVAGAIDIAQSFVGLKKMLRRAGIDVQQQPESLPDGPMGGLGRIFPVPGGLLRTAALEADVLDNDIMVVEGKENSIHALQALARGEVQAKFVDILFCDGCIDGPTMDSSISLFARKEAIANCVRLEENHLSTAQVEAALAPYKAVDLSRSFAAQPVAQAVPSEEEIGLILERIHKREVEDQLNCGACGYATCRDKAIAVHEGLAGIEMCLPYLIDQLESNLHKLESYQRELQETQAQLVHTEKLATVGQLAAGIAHELNNPLGTILIYSHLMLSRINPEEQGWKDIRLIVDETTRCKGIVAGLLDFARQRKVFARETNVNQMLDEILERLHMQPNFQGVSVRPDLDLSLPHIQADANQLSEVFWNILTNAGDAMPAGGQLFVSTRTADDGTSIVVSFADTGIGIGEEGLRRLFTPFFTTKPRGTGLGLAIAYGIVKCTGATFPWKAGSVTVLRSPSRCQQNRKAK
jgi:two-component system, NtrC family, sensor kinase